MVTHTFAESENGFCRFRGWHCDRQMLFAAVFFIFSSLLFADGTFTGEYASIWRDPNGSIESYRAALDVTLPHATVYGSFGNLNLRHMFAKSRVDFAHFGASSANDFFSAGLDFKYFSADSYSGTFDQLQQIQIKLKNGTVSTATPRVGFTIKDATLFAGLQLTNINGDYSDLYYFNARPEISAYSGFLGFEWKKHRLSLSVTDLRANFYSLENAQLISIDANIFYAGLRRRPVDLGIVALTAKGSADFKPLAIEMFWPFLNLAVSANGWGILGFAGFSHFWEFAFFELDLKAFAAVGSVPNSFLQIAGMQKKMYGGQKIDQTMQNPAHITGAGALLYTDMAFKINPYFKIGLKKSFAFAMEFGKTKTPQNPDEDEGSSEPAPLPKKSKGWFYNYTPAQIAETILLSGLSVYVKILW